MARSAYIYVLMDDHASLPTAAFTVKHELVTYLKHQNKARWEREKVYRYKDNPSGNSHIVTEIKLHDLLPEMKTPEDGSEPPQSVAIGLLEEMGKS